MHEFTQKRESSDYRYHKIYTPFQDRQQITAGKLGHTVQHAKIWRNIAFFCFFINLLLSLWLIVLIKTPWTEVTVAQMVGNGFIEKIGRLNQVVSQDHDQGK